jgi:hypothetical protein
MTALAVSSYNTFHTLPDAGSCSSGLVLLVSGRGTTRSDCLRTEHGAKRGGYMNNLEPLHSFDSLMARWYEFFHAFERHLPAEIRRAL